EHHQADPGEEPHGLHRPCPPGARRGGGGRSRHHADPDLGLRVRQQRDLRPLRGVGPRLRRLRHPEPHGAGERVDHGAPHHGRRAQAGVGEADHGRHAVLRLRAAGQEAPRPRADLRAVDGRPLPHRGRRPADGGRPAHRADPGVLRRPGRPPHGDPDPQQLRLREVRLRPRARRHAGPGDRVPGRGPDQGRRAVVGEARRRAAGLHPQDPGHPPAQRVGRQPRRRRGRGPHVHPRRRHDRHRRDDREGRGGAAEAGRGECRHRGDARDPLRPRRRPAQELPGHRGGRHQHVADRPGPAVRQAHRAVDRAAHQPGDPGGLRGRLGDQDVRRICL
ncbi:MAG: Ribose-phosphate pyrophosphokinase, partial [uncultured Nocardioidaceae bacterium]